jgi:hypothetical protein
MQRQCPAVSVHRLSACCGPNAYFLDLRREAQLTHHPGRFRLAGPVLLERPDRRETRRRVRRRSAAVIEQQKAPKALLTRGFLMRDL